MLRHTQRRLRSHSNSATTVERSYGILCCPCRLPALKSCALGGVHHGCAVRSHLVHSSSSVSHELFCAPSFIRAMKMAYGRVSRMTDGAERAFDFVNVRRTVVRVVAHHDDLRRALKSGNYCCSIYTIPENVDSYICSVWFA